MCVRAPRGLATRLAHERRHRQPGVLRVIRVVERRERRLRAAELRRSSNTGVGVSTTRVARPIGFNNRRGRAPLLRERRPKGARTTHARVWQRTSSASRLAALAASLALTSRLTRFGRLAAAAASMAAAPATTTLTTAGGWRAAPLGVSQLRERAAATLGCSGRGVCQNP
jgi:hypothetical protein